MQNKEQLLKIGKLFFILGTLNIYGMFSDRGSLVVSALAAGQGEVEFNAQVDQNRIGLGETFALRLTITSTAGVSVSAPEFQAPDFAVISESSSVSMQSFYDSSRGGFNTQHRQQITKLLQPKKMGDLRISDIHVIANGKVLRSKDLTVRVGAAAQAPRGKYGSMPQSGGAPSADQDRLGRLEKAGVKPIFLQAEVDKTTGYRGEQIVVSYYLYHLVKIFNVLPERYPVLNGFLREDLDIPIAGQRVVGEAVTVNGVPYERALMAKYAAFPLETGERTIDTLALKVNYFSNSNRNLFQEDDPFYGFFQQMTPRVVRLQSDLIKIHVKDLPTEGRPADFSGGVGQLSVTSAVNKYEVRANEPVTLTVKVEGQGNTSAIHEPVAKWPETIEMYESKGKVGSRHGSVGEKIFEYLLIPRMPGKILLPALEFSFFDPEKRQYYTKLTEPVTLNVLEPAPGTTLLPPKKAGAPALATAVKPKADLRYLKPQNDGDGSDFLPTVWRALYWAASLSFFAFLFLVLRDVFQKLSRTGGQKKAKKTDLGSKDWERLRQLSKGGPQSPSWNDIVAAYDAISNLILESIEKQYQVGARSLPLSEVRNHLVQDKGVPQGEWDRIMKVLEFSDRVRFASAHGALGESSARTELKDWIAEAEAIVRGLVRSSQKT